MCHVGSIPTVDVTLASPAWGVRRRELPGRRDQQAPGAHSLATSREREHRPTRGDALLAGRDGGHRCALHVRYRAHALTHRQGGPDPSHLRQREMLRAKPVSLKPRKVRISGDPGAASSDRQGCVLCVRNRGWDASLWVMPLSTSSRSVGRSTAVSGSHIPVGRRPNRTSKSRSPQRISVRRSAAVVSGRIEWWKGWAMPLASRSPSTNPRYATGYPRPSRAEPSRAEPSRAEPSRASRPASAPGPTTSTRGCRAAHSVDSGPH